jgi:thioredoxin 1
MIKQANKDNISSLIGGSGLVIVDYFATWCGPCKMMHPIFEELAEKYPEIQFAKVDIDECEEFAIKEGVQVVPTFIAYKGGKAVGKIIGYNPLQKMEEFIKNL